MLHKSLENESIASQMAMVWSIRNQLDSGIPLAKVVLELPDARTAECSEILAATGIIAFVFGDGCSDPTCGATRFHRHDLHPQWAGAATPCALIGSYFYYLDQDLR
jgi:hypothetical protein